MDDNFLKYYNGELTYINHVAERFAEANPKIAGALKLTQNARKDPHVERLLQGVAFLNARMRYKLDDTFPEISDALLGALLPDYQSPIPSMTIMEFKPAAALKKAELIEKGRQLVTATPDEVPCVFCTGYDTTLLPVELVQAKLFSSLGAETGGKISSLGLSSLSIKLQTTSNEVTFAKLAPKKLRFYIKAEDAFAYPLYDLIFKNTKSIGIAASLTDPQGQHFPPSCIKPVGFGLDEGLLPSQKNSFIGYRLLTEMFAFPNKFLFFDIDNIDPGVWKHIGNELFIYLHFDASNKELENFINKNCFAVNCVPAINIYEKSFEPIHHDFRNFQYRLIPDINNQQNYEVYNINDVKVVFPDGTTAPANPFYGIRKETGEGKIGQLYWSTRRYPAAMSSSGKRYGDELYLIVSDVSLSIVHKSSEYIIKARGQVTNGNVPSRLSYGGGLPDVQFLTKRSQASTISCVHQPTQMRYYPHQEMRSWTLISMLVLNQLSLTEEQSSVAALRQILNNFDYVQSTTTQSLIDGILSISTKQILARDPSGQVNAFCKGLEVTIEFDQAKYVGSSIMLFANVLEYFLSMYCSINSFVKLIAVTAGKQKVIHKWLPRQGTTQLL